jgi:hypothetical protein
MADGHNGAYITTREIYDLVSSVRDDVRDVKQAFWLHVEADAKIDDRRDKDIDRLKFRYYGIVAGLIAAFATIFAKGGTPW